MNIMNTHTQAEAERNTCSLVTQVQPRSDSRKVTQIRLMLTMLYLHLTSGRSSGLKGQLTFFIPFTIGGPNRHWW